MKQKSRFNLKKITVATYAAVAVLFTVFAVYMAVFTENDVYSARGKASFEILKDYSVEQISDTDAPVGVHKVYSWQIENAENNDRCLMFYIVHSYAEVRFDGELVYSVTAANNRIGKSPSSNWVIVPIYPSDGGKKVTVTVTPVYKEVLNREVEFKIGSRYAVFMHRLKRDLPQIILSALCIVMGLLLIIVQLSFIIKKRTSAWDMLYLGCFSLLMGIWRITDTRFSPLMFGKQTAALGYITLSALFIMAVPLLLYIDEQRIGKFRILVRIAALVNCAVAFVSLLCQVMGISELREMLKACHVMLAIDILAVAVVSFFSFKKGGKERTQMIFIILIMAGSISDFVYFYTKNTSSNMVFTTVAFLIYTLYLFTENILNINKKAYIDENTKLFNRTRWEEFIKEIPRSEPIGIMMMDLNRLKHVNDTLGHKLGDKMIVNFAEILRNTFDYGEFLCRWGGDEFTVIVRNATGEKMERYYSDMHKAVEAYNSSGAKPEIYFACGYALSAEEDNISINELLTKADERMYLDKQQWYNKHFTA